jgi:hypothetical protein
MCTRKTIFAYQHNANSIHRHCGHDGETRTHACHHSCCHDAPCPCDRDQYVGAHTGLSLLHRWTMNRSANTCTLRQARCCVDASCEYGAYISAAHAASAVRIAASSSRTEQACRTCLKKSRHYTHSDRHRRSVASTAVPCSRYALIGLMDPASVRVADSDSRSRQQDAVKSLKVRVHLMLL